MDDSATKAIQIAVGVFITIIITTGVIYVINNIKDVYGGVYKTNVGLQDEFYEFDEYENTEKTGIDLLNTVKKYLDSNIVKVHLNTDNNNDYINRRDSTYYQNYLSKRNEEGTTANSFNRYLSSIGQERYNVTFVTQDGFTNIYFKTK